MGSREGYNMLTFHQQFIAFFYIFILCCISCFLYFYTYFRCQKKSVSCIYEGWIYVKNCLCGQYCKNCHCTWWLTADYRLPKMWGQVRFFFAYCQLWSATLCKLALTVYVYAVSMSLVWHVEGHIVCTNNRKYDWSAAFWPILIRFVWITLLAFC